MNNMLLLFLPHYVLVFFDDILILSSLGHASPPLGSVHLPVGQRPRPQALQVLLPGVVSDLFGARYLCGGCGN